MDRKKGGEKVQQVRIGAAIGSTDMEELGAANAAGAGVVLQIQDVGADPNEGVSLDGKRQGAE